MSRDRGLGFGVWGPGIGVQGPGFGVWSPGIGVQSPENVAWDPENGKQGSGDCYPAVDSPRM